MYKLAKKNVTPPGGFRFQDPDTKYVIKAANMPSLVTKVNRHRRANSLGPFSDTQAAIEQWLCLRMPEGICIDESGIPVRRGVIHKTAGNAARATTLMIRMARGQRKVSQNVAQARAETCAKCSQNKPFVGCMSCSGLKSLVAQATRGLHTNQHGHLHACGVCGVLNEVHVWIPDNIILDTIGRMPYPTTCWKSKLKGVRCK